MTAGHLALILFVLALIGGYLLLRQKEQTLRVDATPAAASCEPIDYRAPGYRHPWDPVDDPDKDPRSFA